MQKRIERIIDNCRRHLNFFCRISMLGWIPNHRIEHRNRRMTHTFFCLSFYKKRTTLSITPHGKVLNAPLGNLHDELFFGYAPEVAEQLFAVLGIHGEMLFNVALNDYENQLLQQIYDALNHLDTMGAPDRLDRLAFCLICELFTQSRRLETYTMMLTLHEAAQALEQGETLATVLRRFGFSRRNFYRLWGEVFSIPPRRFMIDMKLKRAVAMLQSPNMTLKEVAVKCGFSSPSYFCRIYRAHFGVSPRLGNSRHTRLPQDSEPPVTATPAE